MLYDQKCKFQRRQTDLELLEICVKSCIYRVLIIGFVSNLLFASEALMTMI